MWMYISFRALLTLILSLIISAWFGEKFIKFMKRRNISETARDASIDPFGEKKKGVPTMGGIIIAVSILIPVLLLGRMRNIYLLLMIGTTVWLGFLGFLDDYIKIFRKNKEGLKGKYKIVGQVSIGLIVGLVLWASPDAIIRENITTEKLGTHRRKVLNSPNLGIMLTPAEDGKDIVTTIDVGMQDLAERAVIDELQLINGNVGVAIVMEVATGDIKAIVNMEKCGDGEYRERKNHAVNDLREPGSVFKTASLLVALDDGVVDTTYRVETGSGVWPMYGREMKDHNWRKGGYGNLTLPQTLHFSSNIGVSRIIDEFYHKTPEKFVEGIYMKNKE